MALYTYFEGMDDLRRAVRLEWFNRLSEQLARVSKTSDPVADLAAVGWAYFFSAVENEHMFRATVVDPLDVPLPATIEMDTLAMAPVSTAGPWGSVLEAAAAAAFQVLADSVQRCTDTGRLRSGDAAARALQIWMMGNGVLVACLAGFITVDDAVDHFYEMSASLLTTYGDDPDAARESFARGRRRMERRMKAPSQP